MRVKAAAACAIVLASWTAVADPSDERLPPCDRACERSYDCVQRNEPPIEHHCTRTCDARRADALVELSR